MNKKKRYLFSDFVKNDMNNLQHLYKNVREYAKHIGFSHTVIHDMLNGKYNSPSPLTAARICEKFDLSPSELFNMINNVNDKFLEEFEKKYNGGLFESVCKNAIECFVQYNNHPELLTDDIITDNNYVSFYEYNLDELEFINTNKNSIYNNKGCNAICSIYSFEKKPIYEYDEDEIHETGAFTIENLNCEELAIHYLPSRRMKEKSDLTYADENIRDFINKFFYLITTKDPSHYNNVFLTTSKKLYDEILEYTNGLDIVCNNYVEIELVYCQYRHGQKHTSLIKDKAPIKNHSQER